MSWQERSGFLTFIFHLLWNGKLVMTRGCSYGWQHLVNTSKDQVIQARRLRSISSLTPPAQSSHNVVNIKGKAAFWVDTASFKTKHAPGSCSQYPHQQRLETATKIHLATTLEITTKLKGCSVPFEGWVKKKPKILNQSYQGSDQNMANRKNRWWYASW